MAELDLITSKIIFNFVTGIIITVVIKLPTALNSATISLIVESQFGFTAIPIILPI